jgi:hypothetical protein
VNLNFDRQRPQKEVQDPGRWTAKQCRTLFQAKPMPDLRSPAWELAVASPLRRPAFLRDQDEAGPFVVIPKS